MKILKSVYLIILGFLIFLNVALSYGQTPLKNTSDTTLKHQIALRHDNDFLTFTDRYYSSGLFLSYGKKLENGVFNSGQEQLLFSLSQEIYTPSNTKTKNIAEMDRPYAGFLGLTVSWSYVKNSNGLDVNFMTGIAGKASGAGDFHRWYHNALEVPSPPTWAYEIVNSFHTNIYLNYNYEWLLVPGDFTVHFAVQPKIAFGTKDIYAQPEIAAYFGKRNTMSQSIAYNQIGSTNRELFFALRTGYKFVNHNAALEGNILGDDSFFTVDPNSTFFYFGFDLKCRYRQNDYWFGYRYNSSETKATKSHKYIVLSYARNF